MILSELQSNRLKDLPKTGYIVYKLLNLVNGKFYIGITVNLNNRIREHIKCSTGKYPIHCYIHKAIHKYGLDKFDLSIITECNSEEELSMQEKKLILESSSNQSSIGYNLTSGGERFTMNEETILKMRESQRRVKVASYNLQGQFIKIYNSLSDAERETGVHNGDIVRCCKRNKQRNGLMFRRFQWMAEPFIIPHNSNSGKHLKERVGISPNNSVRCKSTNKVTGEVIEANSIEELASKLGLHKTTLFTIIKNTNHKKLRVERL